MKTGKLVVAGGGSWGTALAVLLAKHGRNVTLWVRREEQADALTGARENQAYLPGVTLPESLAVTSDLGVLADASGLLHVVPAQATRDALFRFRQAASGSPLHIALCSKGFERGTMAPMNEVLGDVWPEAIGSVLSGPSFAADVAKGLPTAVTLASRSGEAQDFWLEALGTPTFRPYASADPVGAEIGGAVKNVLAIASGIAAGKGLGESAKAALIARGFAELNRFGLAMGAEAETFSGLSGLGDLVLTCNSAQSRNFKLGRAIGEGADAESYLAQQNTVAEGAATAEPLVAKARSLDVEMPISEGVAAILSGETDADSVIERLMNRPLKREG
jgi:glycerol-3-phosphate dehydrogenase (NAD(P)+)